MRTKCLRQLFYSDPVTNVSEGRAASTTLLHHAAQHLGSQRKDKHVIATLQQSGQHDSRSEDVTIMPNRSTAACIHSSLPACQQSLLPLPYERSLICPCNQMHCAYFSFIFTYCIPEWHHAHGNHCHRKGRLRSSNTACQKITNQNSTQEAVAK